MKFYEMYTGPRFNTMEGMEPWRNIHVESVSMHGCRPPVIRPVMLKPERIALAGTAARATAIVGLAHEVFPNRVRALIAQAIAVDESGRVIWVRRHSVLRNRWLVEGVLESPRAWILAWLRQVRAYESQIMAENGRASSWYADVRRVAREALKGNRKAPAPGWYKHRSSFVYVSHIYSNGDVEAEDEFGRFITCERALCQSYRKAVDKVTLVDGKPVWEIARRYDLSVVHHKDNTATVCLPARFPMLYARVLSELNAVKHECGS